MKILSRKICGFNTYLSFKSTDFHITFKEGSLGNVDFAGIGQDLTGDEYRAGATFEQVTVGIAAIVSEIIIDSQIDDQLSDINSQLQVQISSKAKAMSRYFMNACINYGSNKFSFTQARHGLIGAESFDKAPTYVQGYESPT